MYRAVSIKSAFSEDGTSKVESIKHYEAQSRAHLATKRSFSKDERRSNDSTVELCLNLSSTSLMLTFPTENQKEENLICYVKRDLKELKLKQKVNIQSFNYTTIFCRVRQSNVDALLSCMHCLEKKE